MNLTGAFALTGNGTVSGTFGVTGVLNANGGLVVTGTASVSSNATVGGTLGVTGNTTVGGTLGVTGATTLTGLLTANGGILVNGSQTTTTNSTVMKVQIAGQREANTGYSYQVPLTGFVITIPDTTSDLILNPAGVLATGTINMPATPWDGMRLTIASTKAVTALTHNPGAGQTLQAALATIAADGHATWRYLNNITTWIRVE
jgi:hypothetical protein